MPYCRQHVRQGNLCSLPGSSCFSSGIILLNPVSLACSIVIMASLIEEDGDVDVELFVDEGPTELSADPDTRR